MTQKLLIGNNTTGLETNRESFYINNDAFPYILNGYPWRGRVRRKRGTKQLGRLQRDFTAASTNKPITIAAATDGTATFTLADFFADTNVTYNGQSGYATIRSNQINASFVPGTMSTPSVTITVNSAPAIVFIESGTGVLTSAGGSGTINYASGAIVLNFSPVTPPISTTITVSFSYYPSLPVMGLEDFETNTLDFPTLVALDDIYSYEFNSTSMQFFDVSFYKADTTVGMTHVKNALTWAAGTYTPPGDYQQFWSTNFYGAMFVDNQSTSQGTTRAGMKFYFISNITLGTATTVNITTTVKNNLKVGDFIFVNEVVGTIGAQINLRTGQVTVASTPDGTFPFTAQFPDANFTGLTYSSGGIAQTLTNNGDPANDGLDPIRWFDGFGATLGWVNYCPPTSNLAQPEYLVGATTILPFKGRLCFFGPYTITSGGIPKFYSDQVLFSAAGSPFYAGSTNPFSSGQQITPSTQRANFFYPQTFFTNTGGANGGLEPSGISQQIVTTSYNEDVIIVDFETQKAKLTYSNNDNDPFFFQKINSELGGESTFSVISLDTGMLSAGNYGLTMTTQFSAQRIDLQIPDYIFSFSALNFGSERVTALRDYRNEFVYFTFPYGQNPYRFPNQTLLYNYRENTWAVFEENYTHYGTFRNTALTWATIYTAYPTWSSWTVPWNSGFTQQRYPAVIGGNQQGFVMIKDDGIQEEPSGLIQAISGNTITSTDHCLLNDDYVLITGVLTLDSMNNPQPNNLNNTVRLVSQSMTAQFNFDGDPLLLTNKSAATYVGGGEFTRLSIPIIRTKQFPIFWGDGRKTRVGLQKYLFQRTSNGSVTVNIYVDQDLGTIANQGPIFPAIAPPNSSLIYTDYLPTYAQSYPQLIQLQSLGNQGNGALTTLAFNILSLLTPSIPEQTVRTILTGSVNISFGAPGTATFVDDGIGGFTATGFGVSSGSTIVYSGSNVGNVSLNFSVAIASSPVTVTFYYYIESPFGTGHNQIWQRISTSLIGDTFQIEFTLNDEQVRTNYIINDPVLSEIEFHGMIYDLYPSSTLASGSI